MRVRAIAALGVAAFAVFLVATVPASYVAQHANARGAGRFELFDPQGTLWRGTLKARLNAIGGPVAIERIEWRFLPSRLAAGRLAFSVDVTGDGLEANAWVGRGLSDWELKPLSMRAKARVVQAILPWLAAWRPEGTVDITSNALTVSDREVRGAAKVEWRDAAMSLSDVKPLGSYRIDLVGEGALARLDVATLDGPFRIAGKGEFTAPSRLAFSGEARAEGEQARALEPLLDLIGPARPDGARALEIRLN